ncbi:MAG: monofunctional biosynthetic peptidoglycan transglycosylase, partial [Rickettsiales bacterium]|nr:monofunctional biosynthetic peptidoglycan transglycosylase [Rickettsiales bacterium]
AHGKMPRMKKPLRILATLIASYGVLVMLLSIVYLFAPPVSTLMLARWATLQKVTYTPVPLKRISPHLVRMVMRAEDSRFCSHYGIDWNSLEQTVEDVVADRRVRGASTISMQVTKNLFLWPQQSYFRKTLEIPLALYLNAIWPKARMMEIYLSIAEWGPGIYGAEAAAQTYFHKPASKLTPAEAGLLAAALPNPKRRKPNHPSSYHSLYAKNLQKWANHDVDMSCLR